MAINSPRLVTGPTKPRLHVLDQRIVTHPVEPGETYLEVVDGSITVTTVSAPTREGQVYFHPQQDEGNRWATMYVGVNLNSTLTWIPVYTGDLVNTLTSFSYDPIFDQ